MLRPAPTVISVTMDEVLKFEHHRRFYRYLEEETTREREHEFQTAAKKPTAKQSRNSSSMRRVESITRNSSSASVDIQCDEAGEHDRDHPSAPTPWIQSIVEDGRLRYRQGLNQEGSGQSVDRGHRSVSSEARLLSATPRRNQMTAMDPSSPSSPTRHLAHTFAALTTGQIDVEMGEAEDVELKRRGSLLADGISSALSSQVQTPHGSPSEDAGSQMDLEVVSEMRDDERRVPSDGNQPPDVVVERRPSPTPVDPRNPFRVYDDGLPASLQPQTPQNLPEARHQSRLRGSYTVPPRPMSPHWQPVMTPTTGRLQRRPVGRRNLSPPGLLGPPGFTGLYGGLENTDDWMLMEQASRRAEEEEES